MIVLTSDFFSLLSRLYLPFGVHTGPKANTNKNTNKQIYVVPQNRVRLRRQQIVYYWRNDTNTQLNPIQPYKTQCFTLTQCLSQICTCTHSLSCTVCLSLHTLALSLHSLVSVSIYTRKKSLGSNPCAA
jgi:hypothetical protein